LLYLRAALPSAGREPTLPEGGSEVAGPELAPEEPLALVETMERLMHGFNDTERAMLELSLQGESVRQIAEKLGSSERTVQLFRKQVERKLKRWLSED
jgi:DNA-binding NarL/FixJ family response regulator